MPVDFRRICPGTAIRRRVSAALVLTALTGAFPAFGQLAQQGAPLPGGGMAAISTDGSTIAIAGAGVQIFTQVAGVWTPQGETLTPSDGVPGSAIAISADGNTVLIGNEADGDQGVQGAAWIFVRNGGNWAQQGSKFTVSDTWPQFGTAVALSADGNTALIGARADNYAGAVWVYTRIGTTWLQQGKLTGSDTVPPSYFGSSVALSADGNTALIGGYRDLGYLGASWAFTRSGGVWTQQGAKLVGSASSFGSFQGSAVALSSDGNVALIGGTRDNSLKGAVWVFTRSGTVWTQQGSKLTAADEVGPGFFGWSVALSGDGRTALVGGPDDGNLGAIWEFIRSAGTWSQQGTKLTASGSTSLGWSVSLTGDGSTGVVSGVLGTLNAGVVWVFSTGPTSVTNVGSSNLGGAYGAGSAIALSVAFGRAVTVSGTPQLALNSGGTAFYSSGSGTAALTFTYTVGAGEQSTHLDCASSVALSLNGGRIYDMTGDATLLLPVPGAAGSLGANSNLAITTAPVALSINKSHTGDFAQGQTNAAYTVTVSNGTGAPYTTSPVTVTENLPAGLSLGQMSGQGWTCTNNSCTRSDLLAGGASYPTISVTVNVSSSASSPLVNQATVSGGGAATASVSDSTKVTVVTPVLTVASAHSGVFTQGQTNASYTLTVSNTGANATSGTVTATDTLPSGLTLVSMSGSRWNCNANSCTCGDSLTPGAGYPAITVTVNVSSNAATSLTNRATASGGGAAATATSTDVTTVIPLYLISTIAGGFLASPTSTPTSYPFSNVAAVATDVFGNTYFSSSGPTMANALNLHCVFKLDANGFLSRVAGTCAPGYSGDGGPAAQAQLNFPRGLAADLAGNLYIAEGGNHRIRKVTPDGTITTVAGNGTPGFSGDGQPAIGAQINSPMGLASDAAGNLYIADIANNRIRKISVDGTIATVAGGAGNGYSGDGASATAALLSGPGGVAVDASGNLYIADTNNNRIRMVSTAGIITTVAGIGVSGFSGDNGPATSAQLKAPLGVALDAAGNLYIADTNNNRVRAVSAGGAIHTAAGNGSACIVTGDGGSATIATICTPPSVALDYAGNLYIADSWNLRLRKVSPAGIISTAAGTSQGLFSGDNGPAAVAQLSAPAGIFPLCGALGYIADSDNCRLRIFNWFDIYTVANLSPCSTGFVTAVTGVPGANLASNLYVANYAQVLNVDANGRISAVAGTGTAGHSGDGGAATAALLSANIYGLAVDGQGNLFISDYGNNSVRKVGTDGNISAVAGAGSGDTGGLAMPRGLALDANGNLFIADSHNYRIRRLATDGAITTVAGTGASGRTGDGGPATAAKMGPPYGVAVDGSGNLFISFADNTVRVVTSTGIISTIAGTGAAGYGGDGGPALSALFNSPYGIAADTTGSLYVSDYNNNAIRMMQPASIGLLSVSVSHTGNFTRGQNGAIYTVSVSNSPLAATTIWSIYIKDILPAGLTVASISGTGWSCSGTGCQTSSPIAPGATSVITVTVNVSADAPPQLTNLVYVSYGSALRQAGASDLTQIVSAMPALGIATIHTGNFAQGQNNAVYTAVVYNQSGAASSSGIVTVADTLPTGLSLVSMAGPGWACSTNSCTRGDVLATGAAYPPLTITVNVASNAPQHVTNQSTVSGGGSAGASASDPTGIVSASPALTITKTHSGAFWSGQTGVVYTVTVSNGVLAAPTSGTVTVTENIPTGLTLVSMAGTGWTCNTNTCTRSDVLAGGASYPAIAVTVNVAPNAASQVTNQATVSGGGSAQASASDLTTISSAPALIVKKSHAGSFFQGQTGATYSVVVSNAAGRPPTSGTVTVTEDIPAGLTLISMAGTGWTCLTNACTRSDALSGGASYPAITVTVNVAANAPASVINSAVAYGGGAAGFVPGDDVTSIASPYLISTLAGSIPSATAVTAANFPMGDLVAVTTDSFGNTYLSGANCVFKLDANGYLLRVAGTGNPGYSGDGGPAVNAELNYPRGLAVDLSGNLYIADYSNNRVRMVSPGGIITTIAGDGACCTNLGDGGPPTSAEFRGPAGLAFDSSGNLYVSEYTGYRVRKISGGTVSTVAGTGASGYSGDGGSATSAKLKYPLGIAVDTAGNLYITDYSNHRVREVTSGGIISTVAGTGVAGYSGDGGPGASAQLNYPRNPAIDSSGNLYFADFDNHRVRRLATNGMLTTVAGNGVAGYSGDGGPANNAQLNLPAGVAVDASGNLWIADEYYGTVRKVSLDGTISTVAGNGLPAWYSGDGGPAGDALLNGPTSIANDTAGNLFVVDAYNYRIRKIAAGGGISTIAGNGTCCNSGDGGPATAASIYPSVAVLDSNGNVYFDNGPSIRKVANGIVTTVAGTGIAGYSGDGGPATAAQLSAVGGLAVDSQGNLYIADSANNRVRKMSPNGTILTVAGSGTAGYSGDGSAGASAMLDAPTALGMDSAGNLYIADSNNSCVRRLAANGTITTVAGNGRYGSSGDGGPATAAALYPEGLAVDGSGNLYITVGSTVRKVSGGIISTIAGTGSAGYSGDGGPALAAQLYDIESLAVDSGGNVFLADYGAGLIRMLQPAGTRPLLTVALAHTGSFIAGQTGATYTLTVTNVAGAGPTNGTVTVTDLIPAGLNLASMSGNGWDCATNICTRADPLAAGSSYPPITAIVNVADNAGPQVENLVNILGGGSVGGAAADLTFIGPAAPSLGVTLTHSGNIVPGQSNAVYTAAVFNQPSAPPTSGVVTVAEALPAGLSLVSMSGTGWTCTNSSCWRSDALAGGAGYPPITVLVNVSSTANVPQVNTVSAGGGGSADATATDTILLAPALRLESSHTGTFTRGQNGATYTLVVSNGPSSGVTSTAVTVTENVPSGLSLVSMSGTGWNCTANNCTRGDTLAGNTSYPAITATVNVTATAGSIVTNSATASGGGSPDASAADPTTIIGLPPANDEPASAAVITSLPATFTEDTSGATISSSDPKLSCEGSQAARSVWFRYLAPYTGTLRADTVTSNFDTVLAAYAGSVGAASEIACNDDIVIYVQQQSQIQFAVTAGQTYYIMAASSPSPGDGGALALHLSNPVAVSVAGTHAGSFTNGQTNAMYTVTVTDVNGPSSGPVTVTENLPAGMTLVSMAGDGWTCPSGGNSCTRGETLSPGGSYPPITVLVDVTMDAPASLENLVKVSGGGSETATASDTTAILPSPYDLNDDRSIDVSDVRQILKEALGAGSALHDLNGDGSMNIVDLQMEIGAALGKTCSVTAASSAIPRR